MANFTCPKCSKEFKSYTKIRVYCGNKCLAESKKKVFGETKFCPKCKIEKTRLSFWKNNSKPCGLHWQCIECSKKLYVEKTTDEFIEKERNRCKRKRRIQLGLDPDFEGSYHKTRINPDLRGKNDYVWIHKHGHPNAQSDKKKCKGRIAEHRWVMSEYLKRPLHEHETIHHKNGLRYDNRIENLELWSKSQPPGQRVEEKIKWCIEFLNEYGYSVNKEENLWQDLKKKII